MEKQILFIISVLVFIQGCGTSVGLQRRFNDDFAIATIKKIRVAQGEFVKSHHRYANLNELCQENLVSNQLSDGIEQGYKFNVTSRERGYTAQAIPQNYGTEESEGNFTLYLDETGIIRSATKKGIDSPKWEIAEIDSIPIKE